MSQKQLNDTFVYSRSVEEVERLLEDGANIEATDSFGATLLVLASKRKDYEIVKLLISKGADIDSAGYYKNTALILATNVDDLRIVKLLLESGADINHVKDDGDKAIHYAKSVAAAKILIEYGADVSAIYNHGKTLLQKLEGKVFTYGYEIQEGYDGYEDDDGYEAWRVRNIASYENLDKCNDLIRFLIEECGVPDL